MSASVTTDLARLLSRSDVRGPPRHKGEQYPTDPPTVEEIVAVMRMIGESGTAAVCAR